MAPLDTVSLWLCSPCGFVTYTYFSGQYPEIVRKNTSCGEYLHFDKFKIPASLLLESVCVGGGDHTNVNSYSSLRLDNTGAWVIEVYPSLLCNRLSENVDLYIK